MTVTLNPYLNFRGQAREALEFYHAAFGGDLTVSSFKDFGQAVDAGEEDQVMHGQLDAANGMTLMAADVPSHMDFTPGSQISVSLSGDDDATLRGYWDKLADGAEIIEPLVTAPWGDTFGMLRDRFGIVWLMNIAGAAA